MSTTTNRRSETVEFQNPQPTGPRSIGVHASNVENSDPENEDHPLRTSGLKDLRHPAKALYSNQVDLGATMISNEDSEEEDYHTNFLHKSLLQKDGKITKYGTYETFKKCFEFELVGKPIYNAVLR